MPQQPGSAWDGVPDEQRVRTSTALWADVVQSVDPDPGKQPVVYTFGGRREFVEPERQA
jgi:hypothetical protein